MYHSHQEYGLSLRCETVSFPKKSSFSKTNQGNQIRKETNKQENEETNMIQILASYIILKQITPSDVSLLEIQTFQVFCIWSLQTPATGEKQEWEKWFLSATPIRGSSRARWWRFSKKQAGLDSFLFPSFPPHPLLDSRIYRVQRYLFWGSHVENLGKTARSWI